MASTNDLEQNLKTSHEWYTVLKKGGNIRWAYGWNRSTTNNQDPLYFWYYEPISWEEFSQRMSHCSIDPSSPRGYPFGLSYEAEITRIEQRKKTPIYLKSP